MLERYVIHVTKQCNCRCIYCYEQDKTSTYTWKEIKNLIDEIVKYNKIFGIEFLGGEPTLAFDLIKQSVEYLQSISDVRVSDYVITTNGTILTDEIVEFLINHPNVKWAVSLDGTKYMNQLRIFNTPDEKGAFQNTHDVAMDNIYRLLNNIGSNQISVHMVTHDYNINLLSKGIDYLYNAGITTIGVGTVESVMTIGREYCERYITELDIISNAIIHGKYPNLVVDVLDSLKPRTDVRHYMYDENHKLIGESYGRAGFDITKSDNVTAKAVYSNLGHLIDDLRETVFSRHNERKKMYENR